MSQAKRQVAKATLVITMISIVGKGFGFIREQVIASQFGANDLTDAYFAAWAIPLMLVGLVGGAISTAFLPVFLRYVTTGKRQDAWRLAQAVWSLSLTVLILATVLVWAAAPGISRLLVPNFAADEQVLTVRMLRIMLPGVVLMGMATLYSAVLNAFKQFAWPALAPSAMNIGLVIATLVLSQRMGIIGLAWSTLVGVLAQQLLLWGQIRRQRLPLFGLAPWRQEGVKQVGQLAVPILIGTLFSQLYVFVDKGLASGLADGSIAALNYASKLIQLPVSIFVMAVATAIYPALAEFAGRGDRQGLGRAVSAGLRILALLVLPAAIGMLVLRVPLVSLAFERGSFDQVATTKTTVALAYYAVGLVGVANIMLLNRAFYSLHDAITPVKVGIGTAVLNIALDLVLVGPLGHGGLALANSLSVLTQMVFLAWLLQRKWNVPVHVLRPISVIATAAFTMGVIVARFYAHYRTLGNAVAVPLAVLLGVTSYSTFLLVLGNEEAREAVNRLRRLVFSKH